MSDPKEATDRVLNSQAYQAAIENERRELFSYMFRHADAETFSAACGLDGWVWKYPSILSTP